MMAADSRVVLYGNSVFLAGIKAQLEHDTLHPYPVTLNLIAIETGCPQVIDLIRKQNPAPCSLIWPCHSRILFFRYYVSNPTSCSSASPHRVTKGSFYLAVLNWH